MKAPSGISPALTALRIWEAARAKRFEGSDPYDGLRSRLLRPMMKSRRMRLAVIQAVKNCPFDPRSILGIGPGLNPKTLALFRSGAADLPSLPGVSTEGEWMDDALFGMASLPDGKPAFTKERIHSQGLAREIASPGRALPGAFGWGYDFPWQGRAFFLPAYSPTVVTTGFVTEALLHAGSPAASAALSGAAGLVRDCLRRHEYPEGVCFSYSPADATRVYNASLFGARILARCGSDAPAAASAADFVVARQAEDGSWAYGEASHWRWVDSFHTGYVLQLLEELSAALGTRRWDEAIGRGLAFYRSRLFLSDGTARYASDRTRPLDPHCFAQGIVTFLALERHAPDAVEMSLSIARRAMETLWDDRRSGFVFRRGRLFSNRTIHMRWCQAWMFRALSALARRTGDQA